ncbi:MAG: hypothetical protein CSA53_00850 [Gammaproteobacteria bacterium]|nr:MAG: hypothetical protein CSA53_00850 [Gammaproteobacteria bacterium]
MKVAYLIEGFSRRPGAIAGLSLLCVVIGVAVMFFAGTMGVLAIAGGSMMIIPVVLACIAISAAMMMAFWFSPVLLVLHPEVDVVRAIKMSLAGCLDNILPMMVYGLLFILFAVLASIPLGLGWLVLIPMSVMSTYVAYRDIFLVNPEPEAVASSTGGDDEPLV